MTEINSPLLTRINDLESQLAADREARLNAEEMVKAYRILSANSGSHLLAELKDLREKVRGYETGCELTGEHLVRVLKAGEELAERARGLLVELSYCGEPDPERTEKAVESVRDAEDSYRKARG